MRVGMAQMPGSIDGARPQPCSAGKLARNLSPLNASPNGIEVTGLTKDDKTWVPRSR